MLKFIVRLVLMATLAAAGLAQAAVTTLSGRLDDAGNPALIGSFGAPPVFNATDPLDSLQNVALHAFSLGSDQSIRFESLGYAAGGIDPYVSLFLGTDDQATFVRSFAGAAVGDFSELVSLSAGNYIVAIGLYLNMSFAENNGVGTLGDGFTGLGGSDFGNGYYELALTTSNDNDVPEPGSLYLVLGAIAAATRLTTRSFDAGAGRGRRATLKAGVAASSPHRHSSTSSPARTLSTGVAACA
jgi:hypothetical protein